MKAQLPVIALFAALTFAAAGCDVKPRQGVGVNNSVTGQNTLAGVGGTQTVSIESADKVLLAGTLFEADQPHSPGLLLLHQWESDRHSYDGLARRLQARGFAVLTIDGRGFGESTKMPDGGTLRPELTDAAVKAMLGDVAAAFDFLARQKNVAPGHIGLAGASYSSSLALLFAADNPRVAAVVLLSPGINYFGNMPTGPAIAKYSGRPIVMFAAVDDKESADAVDKLMAIGRNAKTESSVFTTGGHGTALLTTRPDTADIIERFFVKYLTAYE